MFFSNIRRKAFPPGFACCQAKTPSVRCVEEARSARGRPPASTPHAGFSPAYFITAFAVHFAPVFPARKQATVFLRRPSPSVVTPSDRTHGLVRPRLTLGGFTRESLRRAGQARLRASGSTGAAHSSEVVSPAHP